MTMLQGCFVFRFRRHASGIKEKKPVGRTEKCDESAPSSGRIEKRNWWNLRTSFILKHFIHFNPYLIIYYYTDNAFAFYSSK